MTEKVSMSPYWIGHDVDIQGIQANPYTELKPRHDGTSDQVQ